MRPSFEFYKIVPPNTRQTQVSKTKFDSDEKIYKTESRFRMGCAYELAVELWLIDSPIVEDDLNPEEIGGVQIVTRGGVQQIRGEDELITTVYSLAIPKGKYLAVSAINESLTDTRTMRATVFMEG